MMTGSAPLASILITRHLIENSGHLENISAEILTPVLPLMLCIQTRLNIPLIK